MFFFATKVFSLRVRFLKYYACVPIFSKRHFKFFYELRRTKKMSNIHLLKSLATIFQFTNNNNNAGQDDDDFSNSFGFYDEDENIKDQNQSLQQESQLLQKQEPRQEPQLEPQNNTRNSQTQHNEQHSAKFSKKIFSSTTITFFEAMVALFTFILNFKLNNTQINGLLVLLQLLLPTPNELPTTAKQFKTWFSSMFSSYVTYLYYLLIIFSTHTQFFCSVCSILQNTKSCEKCKTQNECFWYKLPEEFFTERLRDPKFIELVHYKHTTTLQYTDCYNSEQYLVRSSLKHF